MGIEGVAATIVCSVAVTLVSVHFQTLQIFRSSSRPVSSTCTGSVAVRCISSDGTSVLSGPQSRDEQRWMQIKAIGFIFLYFSLVKLMFTSWVVLHLFCFSVFYKNFQHLEKLFVCISIGIPLLGCPS